MTVIFTFFAVYLMPVSIAVSIMMTTTFVTSIIAWLWVGEKLSMKEIIFITGGFMGVLMLVNPSWFRLDVHLTTQIEIKDEKEYPHEIFGFMSAIAFSIFSALKLITMRDIGNVIHSSVTTFYFGVFSSVISITFMLFYQP